jgi:signal peptidase I
MRRPGKGSSRFIVGAFLAVLTWVFLAPPALGRRTSCVVTRGVGMAPSFHAGDFAVVRQRSAYDLGDVIAYRSPTPGIVVLHRIVAGEPHGSAPGEATTPGTTRTWCRLTRSSAGCGSTSLASALR